MRMFGRFRLTSFRIIAFSFLFLILAGTLLLLLPVSSREPGSAGFSACFFRHRSRNRRSSSASPGWKVQMP